MKSAPKVAHSRNCSIQVEETRISSSYIDAITEVLCCFPRHHLLADDWPFCTIEVVGKIYNHVGSTWVNLVWLHKLGMFPSSTGNSAVAQGTRWTFLRVSLKFHNDKRPTTHPWPQETISISDAFSGLLPMSEPHYCRLPNVFQNRICFTRLLGSLQPSNSGSDSRFQ